MFYQVVKRSSTRCCGSRCCGSETVIWEAEDPQNYATKVFADLDRKNVSIYLLNGKILHFGKAGRNKPWKKSFHKIVLDVGKTSSTIGYDFVHHGETRTLTAKPGYQFATIFLGGSWPIIFWEAQTDDECSTKVTVYGVQTNVKNINIFLKNNEIKHFHEVNKKWVSTTSIVLDIEKNKDNDLFEYRSTRNFGHFNPKANLTITMIVKSTLEIWTAQPGDHGLKVVLMGSGKDEKHLSILLQSGNFVLLRKCGRGLPWEDITNEKSDFSGIKMYSLEEGTSNYNQLTSNDYDPIVFESRYGYEFKDGVKCVKITYNNELLWSHTDDPEFGYLKGLYLDLPKDQFSVTNLKDQTKKLTKAKVVLDIEKTESTDGFDYFMYDDCHKYSANDGYVFSKVMKGTTAIWESTDNVHSTLVRYKTKDDGIYVAILLTNNMFKLFHLESGKPWADITSERHDITKLKFFGENDAEITSSDYSVSIVDLSFTYLFNSGVNCKKIKLGEEEVWNHTDDTKSCLKQFLCEDLKTAAGASPTKGLRDLADKLYKAANALDTEVKKAGDEQAAAKVLQFKAGTNDEEDGKLRKLAKELHSAVSTLENAAPAGSSDNTSLKLKSGTDENDGLRGLAKTLYEAAKSLQDVAGGQDSRAAEQLANEVGATESGNTLRHKLQQLASAEDKGLNAAAQAVTEAYGSSTGTGVQGKFDAVKGQKATYKSANKEKEYQAVEKAWNAFDALYTADLKGLAKELKNAIGEVGTPDKLQKTLQDLGDLPATQTAELPNKAQAVKTAYEGVGSGVKPKFTALKEKESSYQAIAAIKPLYEAVVSAMTAFNAVYKPEELLANAVGDGAEGGGLQLALANLGSNSSDPKQLHGLAKAVKTKYGDNWGNDVKDKFHLVMAQASAYTAGSKTDQYNQLLQAWTKFNDKYYGVISFYKYYIIIIPSIFSIWKDLSPKTNYVYHGENRIGNGFHGWTWYKDHQGGVNDGPESGEPQECPDSELLSGGKEIHIATDPFDGEITYTTTKDITKITVTDSKGKPTTYTQVKEQAGPASQGTPSLTIKNTKVGKGGEGTTETTANFKKDDTTPAGTQGAKNSIILTTTLKGPGSKDTIKIIGKTTTVSFGHIFTEKFDTSKVHPHIVSPTLMVIVGMGHLIVTIFPQVIIAALRRSARYWCHYQSPACIWGPDEASYGSYTNSGEPATGSGKDGSLWHAFDILIVLKISLAGIFIYSLHYRESSIARSIINQPKMPTALTIIFYMFHESHFYQR